MALNDVKIVSGPRTNQTFQVASGAAGSIKAGEPVKRTAVGSPYVVLCATGDPEIGTDVFVGIATSTSTDTATADGTVNVDVIVPGQTVLQAKATTAANVDTAAKIAALEGDTVNFDLTGTTFTIDEDEGDDDNVHSLLIIGGDHIAGTLDFLVKGAGTVGYSIL